MTKALRLLLMTAAAFLLATPSMGDTFNLDLNIGLGFQNVPLGLGGIKAQLLEGAQVSGDASGILTKIQLTGTAVSWSATIPLTDPENATLVTLMVEGKMTNVTLSRNNQKWAVQGKTTLCLLVPGCLIPFTIPYTQDGTRGIGLGGMVTINTFAKGGGLKISLIGAPWEMGPVVYNEATPNGTAEFQAIGGAGGWPFTETDPAIGGGTVTEPEPGADGGFVSFVTPVVIQTNTTSGGQRGVIRVAIRFVPEPGNALLLLSGIGGLLCIAKSKRRR